MGSKSKKGSAFERELCVRLSRWWTNGKRDDVFWRASGSGARATVRGRKGRKTTNSYGDVAALDSVGARLLDFVTIEIKRGYSTHTIHDMLDKGPGSKASAYEDWLEQVRLAWCQSGAYSWWLIVRRNRRVAVVLMPLDLWKRLPIDYEGPVALLRIESPLAASPPQELVCAHLDAVLTPRVAAWIKTTGKDL